MPAPQTPDEYIAGLPEDRRETVRAVRQVVRANLPAGFEEGKAYGMIAWYVPLERFPNTYNGQPLGLAGLASQKNYISLYLNSTSSPRPSAASTRSHSSPATKRRAGRR